MAWIRAGNAAASNISPMLLTHFCGKQQRYVTILCRFDLLIERICSLKAIYAFSLNHSKYHIGPRVESPLY